MSRQQDLGRRESASHLRGSSARWDILFVSLAAAFPVMALAIENWAERIAIRDLVLVLSFAVAIAYIIWFAAHRFSRDPDRQLLVSVLIVGWTAFYGYIVEGLRMVVPWDGRSPWAGATSAVVVLALCYWILWRLRSTAVLARMLRSFIVILTMMQAGRFVLVIGRSAASTAVAGAQEFELRSERMLASSDPAFPDIYLIILDAYTGNSSLRGYYGFDNSPFIQALEERGFVIPAASRSNYAMTFLSLASMLNWMYLDDIVPRSGRGYDSVYELIRDNRTLRFLLDRGYKHIFIPSGFTPTRETAYADSVVVVDGQSAATSSEFVPAWLEMTIWGHWAWYLMGGCLAPCQERPEIVRWRLEQVGSVASHPGPKFVFAHMLVPHPPFIFAKSCEVKEQPDRGEEYTADAFRAAYLEQLQCVNRMVVEMVDSILANSEEPPVILLQADHGHGLRLRAPPIEKMTQDELNARFDIFGAYLLPDGGEEVIYPSISPVNLLPRVLNYYFSTDIPVRDDRSYYSSWMRPYEFSEFVH
jgi:hypothetical protein